MWRKGGEGGKEEERGLSGRVMEQQAVSGQGATCCLTTGAFGRVPVDLAEICDRTRRSLGGSNVELPADSQKRHKNQLQRDHGASNVF